MGHKYHKPKLFNPAQKLLQITILNPFNEWCKLFLATKYILQFKTVVFSCNVSFLSSEQYENLYNTNVLIYTKDTYIVNIYNC